MIAGHDKDGISEAAYLIWEAEGRPHGRDMEHWLKAEKLIAGDAGKEAQKRTLRHDDLKKITGIGPVLAGKLSAMGITSFAQIAAFTDEDIERIGAALKCKARILGSDWKGQAKKLSSH
ncbi:MAG TPA: DUF2934 domain-containing protein [Rhizobiales bacterium]|nr:DUF2934 domain-containing protein [Hyphomicrobiales bacterium]